MIKLLLAIFFISSFNLKASTPLKVGDILLLPLDCLACTLIEQEEETIYSHMGIVLSVNPEVQIAESWGKVKLTPVAEFVARAEQGQKVSVLRFQNERISKELIKNYSNNLKRFSAQFEGHQYDPDFLWNNFDENGEEKFYCSELVTKMLQSFLGLETPIKRMHFQKNRDQWAKYFKGNIPDGKWGNSPADFERSDIFYRAGEL